MAKTYEVPPDIKEKEKIFGGYFNINQVGWLGCGLLLGIVLFLLTASFLGKILSGFCFILGISLSLPFVFYKKHGLTLFQLLKLKAKFKKSQKVYINKK